MIFYTGKENKSNKQNSKFFFFFCGICNNLCQATIRITKTIVSRIVTYRAMSFFSCKDIYSSMVKVKALRL